MITLQHNFTVWLVFLILNCYFTAIAKCSSLSCCSATITLTYSVRDILYNTWRQRIIVTDDGNDAVAMTTGTSNLILLSER